MKTAEKVLMDLLFDNNWKDPEKWIKIIALNRSSAGISQTTIRFSVWSTPWPVC
jgi:hypothetical protein